MAGIAWVVTGAGHFLPETFEQMKRFKNVSLFLSSAGAEVLRVYGLEGVKRVAKEVVEETSQGASFYAIGNVMMGEFDVVVVSPCTANAAAKIVCGIADDLASNMVAQALKAGVPVVAVPTDLAPRQETALPIYVDKKKCRKCQDCPPVSACPENAFFSSGRIDLLLCNGCRGCIPACPFGAISFGRKAVIRSRAIDRRNARMLAKAGVRVLRHPKELGGVLGKNAP